MSWRLEAHVKEAQGNDWTNPRKCRWILQLLSQGLQPEIVVVDEGFGDSWQDAETFWIRFYREEVGSRLLNMTDGGEGATGHRHSPESRAKMGVRKGAHHTPEAIRKIRDARAHQIIICTPERNQKVSEAKKGKKRPDMIGNTFCKLTIGNRSSNHHDNLKEWRGSLEPDLLHEIRSRNGKKGSRSRWGGVN